MTRQQMFNTAYHGLAAQGFEQSKRGQSCVYRGTGGKRCALGYLLSDQLYKQKYDTGNYSAVMLVDDIGSGIFTIRNQDFLNNLQIQHDTGYSPESMKANLAGFAVKYDLTIPVLPVTADAPAPIETKEHEYADHG